MRNNNLNDSFQAPSNPFENQNNFDFNNNRVDFNNQSQKPNQNNIQRNNGNQRRVQENINTQQKHRIAESVSLNEILLAPISALYSFTIKIHSGFRLDEEVKVLASTQTAYLVLGLITNSKVYFIMSLGNIFAIIVVLILASSYINLPDYLSPNGILNRKSKDEEYEEAMRNYNHNMNSNMSQNTNQNPNMGPNMRQNINYNSNLNNQGFRGDNTQQVDPNYNDNYIRENNNPNMGNNMYNKLNNDTQSFNNFGLNTVDRLDDGVNFGIDNLSNETSNIEPTRQFNGNSFNGNVDNMIDFNGIINNPNQGNFSPTFNNPFKNPRYTRNEIFEQNPYKDRIITNTNKQETFNNMIPRENRDYRKNPVHKATVNVLEMVKDGFASSLSNSSMYKQDEEDFTFVD